MVIIVVVASSGKSSNQTTKTTTTSSSGSTQEKIYNIGDAIQNGDYEITILSVKEASKVGTQYVNSQPSEGGTYVCVDLSYKNISSKPLNSWEFPSLDLVDSNDVKYSSDISASSYYATETDPDRKVLSDLNPGITTKDCKVYEISKENYGQGEWFLVVDGNIKIKVK